MLQFNTDASLTGPRVSFACLFAFFLFMSSSLLHATFNFEVSQLVNNNNAYSDQGVLMEWSGSFNTNGHSYTSFGSDNFLNSPAFVNYYNAQVDHVVYFGGIGSSSQNYLEYETDEKQGIFQHNDAVKDLLPKKSGVTLSESDSNAINHAFKSGSTGNSYDSGADYIMMGDTFAIGHIQYKEGGPVASAQQIFLPQGYVSGTEISGSVFLRGETFESLGILETFGIDTDSFFASANNNPNSIVLASVVEPYNTFSFEVFHDENGNPGGTVSIEINAPVPEPSTYALILGCLTFLSLILRKHFA